MIEKYVKTASRLMDLSNQCENEQIIDILKSVSLKISEMAEAHNILPSSAQEEPELK